MFRRDAMLLESTASDFQLFRQPPTFKPLPNGLISEEEHSPYLEEQQDYVSEENMP